jgi:hypothetical protein
MRAAARRRGLTAAARDARVLPHPLKEELRWPRCAGPATTCPDREEESMSYLDRPRLHFAGKFIANPSTVNNTPQNYDPAVTNPNPGWNPNGSGVWAFLDCTVQAVVYEDGTVCTDPSQDPVVGSPVAGIDQPTSAKLVDLDPEQQMVSEIWGFFVQVGSATSGTFTGAYEVAAFNDIWFRAADFYKGAGGGDAPMGAAYQSVLAQLQWSGSGSTFLEQLQKVSSGRVSIKFNLDGIDMDSKSPTFTQGRIVGTIGPAFAGEPDHFVAGRLLRSAPGTNTNPNLAPMVLQGTPESSPVFFAPCKVDPGRLRLILDLGNSLSTDVPGGKMNPALGTLTAALLSPGGGTTPLGGSIPYTTPNWYFITAGIYEIALTAGQLADVESHRLALLGSNSAQPLLQENPQAAFVRAETFVFRLNPGETATVDLRATRYGKPAADQAIALSYAPQYVDQIQSPPNPASIPVGDPTSALQFPPSVVTDAQGHASFTLTAADPKNPRKFIDGQVYGVLYTWGANEPPDYWHDPTSFVSVLVFNSTAIPANPTWKDVQPILAQYAKLYPYMTNPVGIDLGDYDTVYQNRQAIQQVLSLPKTNPGYMQVTRDMSRDKLVLLLKWLAAGAPQ